MSVINGGIITLNFNYVNRVQTASEKETRNVPLVIPDDLSARAVLENENNCVMDERRAVHQGIRPPEILILDLMPLKEDTEIPHANRFCLCGYSARVRSSLRAAH